MALSFAMSALLFGCSASHGGRLMLVVTSDLPLDAISGVRVEVSGETRDIAVGPAAATLPLSLVIEARAERAAGEIVEIRTSAIGSDGSVLVTRPVRTTFLANRTLVLTVDLARRCTTFAGCAGQLRCNPNEACTATSCVDSFIESSELPDLRVPGEEIGAATSYSAPQACDALADMACGAAVRCCPSSVGVPAEDLERFRMECVVAYREYCTTTVLPLLQDPRTGYDPVRAAAAIQEGMRLAGACEETYADWAASPERGLLSALRGTIGPGESCPLAESADVFACRGGACIPTGAFAAACSSRACMDGACAGDFALADYGCGDGLYCARNPASFNCEPRLPPGETCTRDTQCASQICNEDADTDPVTPGTCQPRTAMNVFCLQADM